MSYDAEILEHEQPNVAEVLQPVMFDATDILEPSVILIPQKF